MIKVNNEKDFLNILKIISEESVKKAKSTLRENKDEAQSNYLNMLRKEESFYNVSLDEKEKNDAEDIDEEEDQVGDEEEVEDGIDAEVFGVSFDSVIKDINTLRAGRSTKDKEIKDELLTYYDRLDEDERKILHLFLRELSKILQGALEGEDAIDPSDAPLYADIIMQNQTDKEASRQQRKTAKRNQKRPERPRSSGVEDSAPPIKVNEQQNLSEIRKRIKNLMKRY